MNSSIATVLGLICYSFYLFKASDGCIFPGCIVNGNSTSCGVWIGRNEEESPFDRQAVIDWSKFNLAKQAFQTCETDGEEGLTWDEVAACEDDFCQLLNIECPTEEEHEAMDLNDDGNLTWSEYLEASFGMLDQESRGLAEEFEF
jgi:hypothetical protein